MTARPLDILSLYMDDPDPKVRATLATALSAENDRKAADMLARLATEDEDETVNQTAIQKLEALDSGMLADLNDNLTGAFDPRMDKSRLINWFRAATLSAQSSQTYLFAPLSEWATQVRNSRHLNRRLRWIRAAGYSIWARLFSKVNMLLLGLPILMFLGLVALTVANPATNVFLASWVLPLIMVVIGGLPFLVFAAPPSLPFRRSVSGALDCLALLGLGAFALVVFIWVFFNLIGEPAPDEAHTTFLLCILVPLILVRILLIAPVHIRRTWLRMVVCCLGALGATLIYYVLLHWIWARSEPFADHFAFDNSGGPLAAMALPMAFLMALHQALRSDHLDTGRPATFTAVLGATAWVGAVFFAVAFVLLSWKAPGGAPSVLRVAELPAADPDNIIVFSEEFILRGNFRMRLEAPADGALEVVVTGSRNDIVQDIILVVDGTTIDQEVEGPEAYRNDKQEAGAVSVWAQLYERDVDLDDFVDYYTDRIRRNVSDLFGMELERDRLIAENTAFLVELSWVPEPVDVQQEEEGATRGVGVFR